MPISDVWELNTLSFVIRFWIEEPATETRPAECRGYVLRVPAGGEPGDKHYVKNLAEAQAFLAAWLRELGADCQE